MRSPILLQTQPTASTPPCVPLQSHFPSPTVGTVWFECRAAAFSVSVWLQAAYLIKAFCFFIFRQGEEGESPQFLDWIVPGSCPAFWLYPAHHQTDSKREERNKGDWGEIDGAEIKVPAEASTPTHSTLMSHWKDICWWKSHLLLRSNTRFAMCLWNMKNLYIYITYNEWINEIKMCRKWSALLWCWMLNALGQHAHRHKSNFMCYGTVYVVIVLYVH